MVTWLQTETKTCSPCTKTSGFPQGAVTARQGTRSVPGPGFHHPCDGSGRACSPLGLREAAWLRQQGGCWPGPGPASGQPSGHSPIDSPCCLAAGPGPGRRPQLQGRHVGQPVPRPAACQGRLGAGPGHHPGTARGTYRVESSPEVHYVHPCLQLCCSANSSGKASRCFKRLYPSSRDST